MTQDEAYEVFLKKSAQEYDERCLRCGACCGVYEHDPCAKLIREEDGRYRCSDYRNRFGEQKTVYGNTFNCVTLRQILSGSWAGSWRCGYTKGR